MKRKDNGLAELIQSPPRLPFDEAKVTYTHHETGYCFTQPKVFVHFKIVEPNQISGTRIYGAYRVAGFSRKARGASIQVRASCDLFRQFVSLSGVTERPNRISLKRLKGVLIRVSLRTVTKDHRQRELPFALQYTVVDEMLEVVAGSLE